MPLELPNSAAANIIATLVVSGRSARLTQTLAGLKAQDPPPTALVVIDATPEGTSAPAAAEISAQTGLPEHRIRRVVTGTANHATAVTVALDALWRDSDLEELHTQRAVGPNADTWVWLLGADTDPLPGATAALLREVESTESAVVLGMKQLLWERPRHLAELGMTATWWGRRIPLAERGEIDQGQHDGVEDVLAVNLKTSLIRADVWHQMASPEADLEPFEDGMEYCRRVRLAGHRVVVVPSARVRHDGPAARSHLQRRRAFLLRQYISAPLWALPFVVLFSVVAAPVRAAWRVARKELASVAGEFLAPLLALAAVRTIMLARRRASRTAVMPRRTLRPLLLNPTATARHRWNLLSARWQTRRAQQAPSELEQRELAAARRRRRIYSWSLATVAVAITAVAVGRHAVAIFGGALLSGPGIAFGEANGPSALHWATYGWNDAGLGDAAPADPLSLVLGLLALPLGSVNLAITLVLLGSVLFSGFGAWLAAGALTRSNLLRTGATLLWLAAPALWASLGQGQVGAVVAHCALPWVVLAYLRATGLHQYDAVRSGLSAHRNRKAHPHTDTEPDRNTLVYAARRNRPSTADAALGALALAVLSAASPAAGSVGVAVVLLLAVFAPRARIRLALSTIPPLLLLAPLWGQALLHDRWRLLLANPGPPGMLPGVDQSNLLLGWPQNPGEWSWLPALVDQATLATLLPVLLVLPLVLAWLGGLLLGRGYGRGLVFAGLIAAVGAAGATLSTQIFTAGAANQLVTAWPGAFTSVLWLGLVGGGLAGLAALRERLGSQSRPWRVLLAVSVLLLIPVVGQLTMSTLSANRGHTSLDTTTALPHPEISSQLQAGANSPRVLHIAAQADGFRAGVFSGNGPQFIEQSAYAATSNLTGPVHLVASDQPARWELADQAAWLSPNAATIDLSSQVAKLVSKTTVDAAADLSRFAVGHVIVAPAANSALSGQTAQLVANLDSVPGLVRVAQGDYGTLWRVTLTDDAASGAFYQPTWATLVGSTEVAVASQQRQISTQIPDDGAPRILVLSSVADPGWQATLDGTPLRRIAGDTWQQQFDVPAGGGHLEVTFRNPALQAWKFTLIAVFGFTALLAIPARRLAGRY